MKRQSFILGLMCIITLALCSCGLFNNGEKSINKLVDATKETGLLNDLKLVKEFDDHGYYRKTYDNGTILEVIPNNEYEEFNIRLPENYTDETVEKTIIALLKASGFTGDYSLFKKDIQEGEKTGGQIYGQLGIFHRYRVWFPSESNERKLFLTLYHKKDGKPLPSSSTN